MKKVFWTIFTIVIVVAKFSVCSPVVNDENIFKKIQARQRAEEDNSSEITDDERQFVREIEEKYNIKSEDDGDEDVRPKQKPSQPPQRPLPAIVAIEIVDDNATAVDGGKGKRTIDANLGYGYKTNNGYFYQHFGPPGQQQQQQHHEQGKFMIYPYSQHDIPPYMPKTYKYHTKIVYNNNNKHNNQEEKRYHVEILPSKAYELVPVDDRVVQSIHQPPPPYRPFNHYQNDVTTLYSTLNGGGRLSGHLSGHFPSVMQDFFVSPTQFLDHYPGLSVPDRQKSIVPVIILRIPSSQVRGPPTAELFPKVSHDSPLNNIDLQAIVDEYLASVGLQYGHHHREPVYEPQPYYYHHPAMNLVHYQHEQHRPVEYVNPIYVPPPAAAHVHPVYEDEENLPFSENYPDDHHTQVVYAPQHVQEGQHRQQEQIVNHIEVGSHVQVEGDQGQEEQGHGGGEEHQPPYNYHAHPLPVRQAKQVKPSDEAAEKTKKTSRRLRSGALETAI